MLCFASEYFKALCGAESRFQEREKTVIELKDDDPDAVDTMLRYLYNFPYPKSTADSPKFHINNFIAARKYLLTELEPIALAGVRSSIESVQAEYNNTKDITAIFELFQLLSSHREQHKDFSDMVYLLATMYLGGIFAIPEFRRMLEKDENKDILDLVVKAVRTDREGPSAANGGESRLKLALCVSCRFMWAPDTAPNELAYLCLRCNSAVNSGHQISRWRRV